MKKNRNNVKKGKIGEHLFIYEFLKKGYTIFKPLDEDTPCDFILSKGNKLLKVQLKSAHTLRTDIIKTNHTKYGNYRNSVERYFFRFCRNNQNLYKKSDIDFLICLVEPTKDFYVFPVSTASKISSFNVNPKRKDKNKYFKYLNNFDILENF